MTHTKITIEELLKRDFKFFISTDTNPKGEGDISVELEGEIEDFPVAVEFRSKLSFINNTNDQFRLCNITVEMKSGSDRKIEATTIEEIESFLIQANNAYVGYLLCDNKRTVGCSGCTVTGEDKSSKCVPEPTI